MRRLISIPFIIIVIISITLYAAQGTPSNLIVRTDANNYLLVTSVTQTNPVTQGIFSSRTLRTDSSGSLQVILTGTVTPTYPMAIPASTCAAPSLGESGAATTGIAFTATPSILMCIAGTAVSTLTATLNTLTISQAITRGTITTDLPVRTDTVTWNNAGVTFTGWKLVVTDTASAAASLLIDLQTAAGGTKFRVDKTGQLTISANFITANGQGIFSSSRGGLILGVSADGIAQFLNGGSTGWTRSIFGTNDATANGFSLSLSGGGMFVGSGDATLGTFIQQLEQTAPAAGAANTARIYAVDNGAGKTQVCAIFSSGAAQCFATQP